MGVGDVLFLGKRFEVPVEIGHVLKLNVSQFVFGVSEGQDVNVLEDIGKDSVCVFLIVFEWMARAIIVKESHSVMEGPF